MDVNKSRQTLAQGVAQYAGFASGATVERKESFRGKVAEPTKPKNNSGFIGDALSFSGNIASQTGSIAKGAAIGLGMFVVNSAVDTAKGTYNWAEKTANVATGEYSKQLDEVNLRNEQASALFAQSTKAFRAGKMDREAWDKSKKDYLDTMGAANTQIASVQKSVDKTDYLEDAAQTLSTIFAFGKFQSIAKAGVVGGKANVINNRAILSSVTNAKGSPLANSLFKLDDLVAKVPSVRDLLVRSGASGVGRGVVDQSARDVAMGLLIKQPLVYHQGIDDVSDISRDLAGGKYGAAAARAAFTATLVFDGGIFGRGISALKRSGTTAKRSLFGVGSTVDLLGRNLKESSPTAVHELLEGLRSGVYKQGSKLTKPEKEAMEYLSRLGSDEVEDTLKLFNESMLRATDDDAYEAVMRIAGDNANRLGRNLEDVSVAEWVAQNHKYQVNAQRLAEQVKAGKIKGLEADDYKKVALGVFDAGSKKQFLTSMKGAEDELTQLKKLNEIMMSGKAPAWMQNNDMHAAIIKRIKAAGGDYTKLKKSINAMTTARALKGIPKKLAKDFQDAGYVVIRPFKRESPFVTLEESRNLTTEFAQDLNWDPSFAPNKALRVVGGAMKKMGLSPEDTNKVAFAKLKANMDESLGALEFTGKSGEKTLKTLRNYAETKRAVVDLRMLRKGEIEDALQVTSAQAKQVMKAINSAHMKIPLELRGLADSVLDRMYAYTPHFKYQSRIQSGARYAYNPFFKLQENVESEVLSQLAVKGKRPSFPLLDDIAERLYPNYYDKLDDATQQLQRAGIFSETFSGAGADDVVLGRITANMTKSQRRSLSGLALKIADKQGTDLATLMARDPEMIEDALRIIVQYPKRGAVNSSMVKMLNLAVFPTRYNLKITGIAAKQMAELPPTLQLATINSLMDFGNWLDGEEGLAWRQEHREAIQLFKWITPIGSLDAVAKAATGNIESAGDLGMLGGLPFGMFGQVLDSMGIVDLSTPYVNIETGEVYDREVPETAKGAIYLATVDLLNQLFTYPGRTLGLPGKTALLRDVASSATGVKSGVDTTRIDQEPYITDRQRKEIEMIRSKFQTNDQPETTIGFYTIPIMEQLKQDKEGMPVLPKSQRKKSGGGSKAKPLPDTSLLGL